MEECWKVEAPVGNTSSPWSGLPAKFFDSVNGWKSSPLYLSVCLFLFMLLSASSSFHHFSMSACQSGVWYKHRQGGLCLYLGLSSLCHHARGCIYCYTLVWLCVYNLRLSSWTVRMMWYKKHALESTYHWRNCGGSLVRCLCPMGNHSQLWLLPGGWCSCTMRNHSQPWFFLPWQGWVFFL